MKEAFRRDPLGLATLVIAVCAIGAAVMASRGAAPSAPAPRAAPPETSAELVRCRGLGEGGGADARCHAAWAESRRRFFGGGERP